MMTDDFKWQHRPTGMRHLGEYPIVRQPDGSWVLSDAVTGKVIQRYKPQSFRAARLRRKALMAGVSVNRARGLPE
jgi:hypothetical protein